MTIARILGIAGLTLLSFYSIGESVPKHELKISLGALSPMGLINSEPSIPTRCWLEEGDIYVFIHHYPTGDLEFIESVPLKDYYRAAELLLTLQNCENINYFEPEK